MKESRMLPQEWAETGRWSTGCQWPGLWSRAAAVCKRSSSWTAPRWPRPGNTRRSASHTGSHSPKLMSRGEAEEREEEVRKEGGSDALRIIVLSMYWNNHRSSFFKKSLKEYRSSGSNKSLQEQKTHLSIERQTNTTAFYLHSKIVCPL